MRQFKYSPWNREVVDWNRSNKWRENDEGVSLDGCGIWPKSHERTDTGVIIIITLGHIWWTNIYGRKKVHRRKYFDVGILRRG